MFLKKLKQELRKRRAPGAASNGDDRRLLQLMSHSNPFAKSEPIEAIPAYPSDFIDHDYETHRWIFDALRVKFDPDEIRAALSKDTSPIPATINREGYSGERHFEYWIDGYAAFKQLSAMAAAHGVQGGSYFDFGGSTGRVFRHFHFQSPDWKVWSSDFKMTSVDWNLKHFPSEIMAFQGVYFPFLPVEDRSFDLITAMSVFTHIDETETSWLLELRRILKPDGVAIITIHNDDTWLNMPRSLRDVIEQYSPELARNPALPPGRIVSNFRNDDPYRCNTFHSDDYIRSQWGRFFEIKAIVNRFSGPQAGVILKRRD